MKVSAESQLYLSEPLAAMGVAASSRPIQPELACVLLYTENGKLWYYTTNGHLSYRKPVEAEVTIAEEGEALVDYELLQASLSSLTGEVGIFTTKKQLTVMSLTNRKILRRLPLSNPDNLPNIPKISSKPFSISASVLQEAIDRVSFAAIREASRPELYGMHIGAEAMCGDGTRVASYKLGIPNTLTIPVEAVGALDSILPSSGEVEVSVGPDGKWMRVGAPDGSELYFIKLQEEFPKSAKMLIDTLVAKEPKATLVANVGPLKRIFGAVTAYTEKARNLGVAFVKAAGDGESVHVSISVPDLGTFEDVLECDYQGDTFEILLSPPAIVDIASKAREKVEIRIFSSLEPILVQDVDDEGWAVVQTVMATKEMVKQEDEEDF